MELKKDLIKEFKTLIVNELKKEIVTKTVYDKYVQDTSNELNKLKATVTQLSKHVENLDKSNNELSKRNDILELKVHNLKWRMADSTDRETLVFKGLPEDNDDLWNKTEIMLAKSSADVCQIDKEEAIELFERVHCGRPK